MEIPKCDACEKQAVMAAFDVMRSEEPGAAWATFQPVGRTKYGCDDHPVTSREFPRLPASAIAKMNQARH